MIVPIPARHELRAMLGLAGWPRRRVGRIVVQGEAAWQQVVDRSTPPDRLGIASKLRWALLSAIKEGQRKLEVYIASRPRRESERERYLRYMATAKVYAGSGSDAPFLRALVWLPRPAGDHCAMTCMFITTGPRWAGWTGAPLPAGRIPIVVDGKRADEEIAETVVHECCHAWLRPAMVGEELMTTCAQDYAMRISPDAPALRESIDDEERMVRAITACWMARVPPPVARVLGGFPQGGWGGDRFSARQRVKISVRKGHRAWAIHQQAT